MVEERARRHPEPAQRMGLIEGRTKQERSGRLTFSSVFSGHGEAIELTDPVCSWQGRLTAAAPTMR
jgi:hypothetical protein